MNIGLRALMVIADGLQQKDEPPAMPKSMGWLFSPFPSFTLSRSISQWYDTENKEEDIHHETVDRRHRPDTGTRAVLRAL